MSILTLSAQSRADLEEERIKIIKEIELAEASLEKTSKDKTEKLKDLKALQDKITRRRDLVDNIKQSIQQANKDIADNNARLEGLVLESKEVRTQYEELLRYSYLKKLGTNKWAYILSSQSLNNAFLRWRYMKQFEQYCIDKAKEINEIQIEIDQRNQEILRDKAQQNQLLNAESEQVGILQKEKKQKDAIVAELHQDEQKWKRELQQAKKEREKLNKAIENAIVSELKKREAESKETTAETSILSDAFAENQGKYSWPVDEGFITGKFGVHNHPSLKGVKISNNGIDIRASQGAQVKVIHNGNIIGVTEIPGYDFMVIVQHGNFYTVYSKMVKVNVSQGQKVTTGQTIGFLSSDEGILHFEVWKNKSKQNPEVWLRK